MRQCPYCGCSNLDTATECRKCDASFVAQPGTVYSGKRHLVSALTAQNVRSKGLALVVLGLMIKVYWGGYGPWPVIDNPTLESLRGWLQPLMLYSGAAVYVLGWVLHFL